MKYRIKGCLCFMLALCLLCSTGCGARELPPETSPSTEESTTAATTAPYVDANEKSRAEQTVAAFAEANDIPYEAYPPRLIELLARNPETEEFVLEFPQEYGRLHEVDLQEHAGSEEVPLFLQWDKRWGYKIYGSGVAGLTACGPLCLSMAAFYHTGDENMTPEDIIDFAKQEGYCVPGSGSSWKLISEGAKKLGLTVRELTLSDGDIKQALDNNEPVILIMGPGDFTQVGHFILVRGYDAQTGQLLINDPNSRINSQKGWEFSRIKDQIRNLWAIGPGR
ncbi:MAG: C39 family peptidase [Oscillospiraceae bacterium]|nr:C39 family peptidase [Oscillospiraceae bacterium]